MPMPRALPNEAAEGTENACHLGKYLMRCERALAPGRQPGALSGGGMIFGLWV
jgi:hypothetical protein